MEDIKVFENFFEEYVNRYIKEAEESGDEEAKLNYTNKKIHTYHVRDNIIKIAKEEKLRLDMFVVEFIGLFHDIGRFEQYRIYRTFNDGKSCDHAKMSIQVLENEGIISKLNYNIREYIVDPILMHNLKDLPRLEDRKMYHYTSLLRDADKLDGFRSISVYERANKNLAYFKNKSDEPVISDYVYDNIMNQKSIDKYNLTTILESQIVSLGYITSDISYNTTLRLIKENNYVDLMFNKMQDTQRSRTIYNFVKEYIDRRLNNEEPK